MSLGEFSFWKQTAAEIAAETPALGAIRINTTRKSAHVGDGATPGGIEMMRADFANARLPRVYARRTTVQGNETGDGTYATVKYDAEVLDTANAFDPSTGIFTAPYAGLLHYAGTVSLDGLGGSHARVELRGNASNGIQWGWYGSAANLRSSTFLTLPFAAAIEMDAADTFRLQVGVFGSTKTIGFYGANSTSRWCELGLLLVPAP